MNTSVRRAVVLTILPVRFVVLPVPLRAQLTSVDSASVTAVTQRLLDAITNGDSAVWARYLSPRWLITDEEGHRMSRAEYLPTLHGLPSGQSGTLRVVDWRSVSSAGTLISSYVADEEHHYYGQVLRTRFSITDVWVRETDGWRMLSSHVTALPTPIAGRAIPRRKLDAYAGEYVLTPGISLTIAISDSGLELIRRGNHERLYALDERIFVRHSVRGFWVFAGDSLVNWRDNNAVTWLRQQR